MAQHRIVVLVDAPDEIPADNVLKHLNWMLNVGAQEAPSVAEDDGEDPEARAEAREAMQCEVGEPTLTPPATKLVTRLRHIGKTDSPETTQVTVEVENASSGIAICVDGYGLKDTAPGYGGVIFCEIYQGLFRAIIWSDINDDEPTIVGLGDARECLRKGDDGPTS